MKFGDADNSTHCVLQSGQNGQFQGQRRQPGCPEERRELEQDTVLRGDGVVFGANVSQTLAHRSGLPCHTRRNSEANGLALSTALRRSCGCSLASRRVLCQVELVGRAGALDSSMFYILGYSSTFTFLLSVSSFLSPFLAPSSTQRVVLGLSASCAPRCRCLRA